jgi:hypothetical protein
MAWPASETNKWLLSVAEMAFIQAACVAVKEVIDKGMLCSPHNHHYGDYRQFYPLDVEVEVPDPIVPPGCDAPKDNRVRVVFPCVSGAADIENILSPLQRVVIADAARPEDPVRNEQGTELGTVESSLTRAQQEGMHAGLSLKTEGNVAFKAGKFERALGLN